MTSKQLKYAQKSYCFWRGRDWMYIDQIIIIQNMVPLFNEAPWNCCQSLCIQQREEETRTQTRPRVSYAFIGTQKTLVYDTLRHYS